MIEECANIYPAPNLKARRPDGGERTSCPSEQTVHGEAIENWSQESARWLDGGGDGELGGTAARSLSLDRQPDPPAPAAPQVQCPARYVVVRPACVEGGSPGARGHTPTFQSRPAPSMRGPRVTRRARAALASPCPSVASAVALATARARLDASSRSACLPAYV